ncbi:hypothetical protein M885DRAFT_316505 [Pelagophyceae sp. CCMP2097]|nr:hypothetical protein M885DRAFT_316505 [Pelagophyceae sp. CCMP2097]
MRASLLLLACTAALGLAPQRRTVSMSAAPRPRSGGNAPRSGGGAPQRGGGAGRGGAPQSRAGDWNCPSCQASNFAYRSSCFRCGTKGSPKQQQKSSSGPRTARQRPEPPDAPAGAARKDDAARAPPDAPAGAAQRRGAQATGRTNGPGPARRRKARCSRRTPPSRTW